MRQISVIVLDDFLFEENSKSGSTFLTRGPYTAVTIDTFQVKQRKEQS